MSEAGTLESARAPADVLRMLRKAAKGLGLLLLGGVAAWAITILAGSVDAPPFDDSDLALPFEPVPDAENGLAILLAASEGRSLPEETTTELSKMRRAGRWDRALAHALLDPNRDRLDAIDRALAAPHFQHREPEADMPLDPDGALAWGEEQSDRTKRLLDDEALCIERAVARVREEGQGFDALLPCFRLGQRLASAPGNAGARSSGPSLQIRAASTARSVLPHLHPTAADSLRLEAELERHRIGAESWRAVWSEQYQWMKRSLAQMVAARDPEMPRWAEIIMPPRYRVHPNETLAEYAAIARARHLGAGRSCRDARTPSREQRRLAARARAMRDGGKLDRVIDLVKPNGFGRFLVDLTLGMERPHERLRCLTAVAIDSTQALIAVRAYQLEHGTLPPSLDALVPRYLSRVPVDAFDGAPLRYSAERKVLWSVGEDLVDHGGSDDPDAPPDVERLDHSYRIPL